MQAFDSWHLLSDLSLVTFVYCLTELPNWCEVLTTLASREVGREHCLPEWKILPQKTRWGFLALQINPINQSINQ